MLPQDPRDLRKAVDNLAKNPQDEDLRVKVNHASRLVYWSACFIAKFHYREVIDSYIDEVNELFARAVEILAGKDEIARFVSERWEEIKQATKDTVPSV